MQLSYLRFPDTILSMEYLFIAGINLVVLIVVYVMIDKRFASLADQRNDQQAFSMLNQNIQGMQERLDKVGEGMNTRLDTAAKVIATVSKELGQVQEMSRNMRDLQNFLKSPKLRGNIGEQVLQDLLSQHFPQAYFDMQYKFPDGQIVDAALKTDNGIICIDAKFPLENFDKMLDAQTEADEDMYRKLFARDVKKHIKDIANKYILPEQGTVNFAIMYVPSEAVYYEIIRDATDVSTSASDNKILLVSPNGFYYFLKVILTGMQGKRIEEQAHIMLATMQAIVNDASKFGDTLGVLNTHMSNARGALDRVNNDYGKLSGKIEQIKLLK